MKTTCFLVSLRFFLIELFFEFDTISISTVKKQKAGIALTGWTKIAVLVLKHSHTFWQLKRSWNKGTFKCLNSASYSRCRAFIFRGHFPKESNFFFSKLPAGHTVFTLHREEALKTKLIKLCRVVYQRGILDSRIGPQVQITNWSIILQDGSLEHYLLKG